MDSEPLRRLCHRIVVVVVLFNLLLRWRHKLEKFFAFALFISIRSSWELNVTHYMEKLVNFAEVVLVGRRRN